MVTKPGPLCRVKLLMTGRDKRVVRSPEKVGGGNARTSPSVRWQFGDQLSGKRETHCHSSSLAGCQSSGYFDCVNQTHWQSPALQRCSLGLGQESLLVAPHFFPTNVGDTDAVVNLIVESRKIPRHRRSDHCAIEQLNPWLPAQYPGDPGTSSTRMLLQGDEMQ